MRLVEQHIIASGDSRYRAIDKEHGRFLLIYDIQAIGKRSYRKTGKIVPSGLFIEIETQVQWEALDQVWIVSRLVSGKPLKSRNQSYRKEPESPVAFRPGMNGFLSPRKPQQA